VEISFKMADDKKDGKKDQSEKIVMDLCYRIERMCRYSPLDTKEVDDQSMEDRKTVEGLYVFYKKDNDTPEQAARKSRANAIRLLLCEALG